MRSDQYAFCVALWEALHGERPFRGDTLPQLERAKARGPAPPEGEPRFRVPAPILRALRRGLDPLPAGRHPSMVELLARLHTGPRGGRWATLGGVAAAAAAAAALGVLLSGSPSEPASVHPCNVDGDAAMGWTPEVRASLVATLERTGGEAAGARTVAGRLDAFVERWKASLSEVCARGASDPSVDPALACLERRRARSSAVLDLLGDADPEAARAALEITAGLPDPDLCTREDHRSVEVARPADPTIASRVEKIGRAVERIAPLLDGGRVDDAVALARDTVVAAEALGFAPLVAEARLELGNALSVTGAPECSDVLAQAYFEAAGARYAGVAMQAATDLVFTYGVDHADLEQARTWLKHAQSVADWGKVDDRARGRLQLAWGSALQIAGHGDEAIAELEEARGRALAGLGHKEHEEYISILQALAGAHLTAEHFDRARALSEEAASLAERVLGPHHRVTAQVLSNLGNALARTRRWDEAILAFRRALQITETLQGERGADVAEVAANLGATLSDAGRIEEALPILKRAVAIHTDVHGADHPMTAMARINLGLALVKIDPARATEVLRAAIVDLEGVLPGEHFAFAHAYAGLARAHAVAGDVPEARRSIEASRAACRAPSQPCDEIAALERALQEQAR